MTNATEITYTEITNIIHDNAHFLLGIMILLGIECQFFILNDKVI